MVLVLLEEGDHSLGAFLALDILAGETDGLLVHEAILGGVVEVSQG